MQKDFMSMAQGQQPTEDFTQEEIESLQFSDEDYVESGLTPGQSPDAMKTRLLEILQKAGVLEDFSREEKVEILNEIDAYIEALLAKDFKKVQSSYINKLLEQVGLDMGGEEETPTDFTGMMPPGGGMLGR